MRMLRQSQGGCPSLWHHFVFVGMGLKCQRVKFNHGVELGDI